MGPRSTRNGKAKINRRNRQKIRNRADRHNIRLRRLSGTDHPLAQLLRRLGSQTPAAPPAIQRIFVLRLHHANRQAIVHMQKTERFAPGVDNENRRDLPGAEERERFRRKAVFRDNQRIARHDIADASRA